MPAEPVAPAKAESSAPPSSAPLQKPASGASAKVAGADEIDLTSALGSLGDNTPAAEPQRSSLDSVFQKMREDASGTPDYSQQHMTLARTYLEMGQLDEAIGA